MAKSLSDYEREYLDCLERRRSHLVAFLYRLGFSWEDSCDAAQEAIIEGAKLVQSRTVESLRDRWAWLRGVAVKKARQNCRNHWTGWVPLDPDKLFIDPFADKAEDGRLAKLYAAIDHLPVDLRELVTFCYLQGGSYREAMARFNLGINVVTARLRTARELLRSELDTLP